MPSVRYLTDLVSLHDVKLCPHMPRTQGTLAFAGIHVEYLRTFDWRLTTKGTQHLPCGSTQNSEICLYAIRPGIPPHTLVSLTT